MNAAALEPVRWERRRWIYTIAAVFTVQAAMAYFLGQKERRLPAREPFRTSIRMAADEASVQRIAALANANNPTLLALPSLNGFSGAAWLRFPTLDYKPAEWTEPAHWLGVNTQSLGAAFSQFIHTNIITPTLIADKPLPSLIGYDLNFPNEPLPAFSRFRIEGTLASRSLVTPLNLKSWANSELLSNSVVQVVVDADGFTFSPTLLSGSGLKEADEHALSLAAAARFRPLPREQRIARDKGSFTWGKLVFQWHTLPVLDTNIPNPEL